MKKTISLILVASLLCLCLCSCGKSGSIVGIWENEKEGVYAFEEDGTGYVELAGGKSDISWRIKDDFLEIKMEMFGMQIDLFKGAKYEINDDTLIIFTEEKTVEFKKVNDKSNDTGVQDHEETSEEYINTEPNENLEFTLKYDDTYEVSGIGSCNDAYVVIPSKYKGRVVTSIGRFSLSGQKFIKDIVVPESVTTISEYAFSDCSSLKSLNIPSSVTYIGEGILTRCDAIETLTVATDNSIYYSQDNCIIEKATNALVLGCKNSIIPYGVEIIGDSAFRGCLMETMHIPRSVTTIGSSAFGDCYSLESIDFPDSLTEIGAWAFQGCYNLKDIAIPNSVETIENWAFRGCDSFTYIYIPASVTYLGIAFDGCSSITEIEVSSNNPNYYSQNNCIIEKETNTLHTGCENSVIPYGITSIGAHAFEGREGLVNITIPNTVTDIGKYAFENCGNLASINIPDSVTSIGVRAFCFCSSLTSVTIPESVTQIGTYAFDCGDSLKDIYCKVPSKPSGWEDDWISQSNTTVHWS